MVHRVTLIPGDGIGPEICQAALRVLEATGVRFEWDEHPAGEQALAVHGTPLPEGAVSSIRRHGVALKGPVGTPLGSGFRSVNVALRQELDLYVNLRPVRSLPGVRTPFEQVDLVVFRENTEDLYIGMEFAVGSPPMALFRRSVEDIAGFRIRQDAAVSLRVISEGATRRIFQRAFEYARSAGRRLVTAVHKANICKYTDGLFLEVGRQVARDYPDIEFNDRIVDNMCMQLVQKPEQYDVLVLPNLFGDILSDLCAGLVGGLGLAASANLGDGCAVFEPVHGSAPKYAGQNRANPMGMMFSGVLLLDHLGESRAARCLEHALLDVLRKGERVTGDLKPAHGAGVGTSQVADAVIEEMRSAACGPEGALGGGL